MKKKSLVLILSILCLFGTFLISTSASAEKMYVKVSYDFQLLDAPNKNANETGMWVNGWTPVNSIGWENGYNQVVTNYGAVGYIKSDRLSYTQHVLTKAERKKYSKTTTWLISKSYTGRYIWLDEDNFMLWVGESGYVVVDYIGLIQNYNSGYHIEDFWGEVWLTPNEDLVYGDIRYSYNNGKPKVFCDKRPK